jgi:hypothetical protein
VKRKGQRDPKRPTIPTDAELTAMLDVVKALKPFRRMARRRILRAVMILSGMIPPPKLRRAAQPD